MTAHPAPAPGEPDARRLRRLAAACMAAAVVCSLLLGVWELARPVFGGHARYALAPVSPARLWAFGILQALKPVGFVAGLFGFFLVGTRRGLPLRIILGLAASGGALYAVVWIMIAVTARDDAIHAGRLLIGSDAHTNGGALFLWIAPIALGVAGVVAHRIPRWRSAWAILVGFVGVPLFGLTTPGRALIVEGALWLVLGCIIYVSRRGA
jgi:hypothetical protein